MTPVVRILVRAAESLYAWWEGGTVLRVRDLTDGSLRTMNVQAAGCWFGAAVPEHRYEAEIGRVVQGRFVAAARSNRVRTPPRAEPRATSSRV